MREVRHWGHFFFSGKSTEKINFFCYGKNSGKNLAEYGILGGHFFLAENQQKKFIFSATENSAEKILAEKITIFFCNRKSTENSTENLTEKILRKNNNFFCNRKSTGKFSGNLTEKMEF